MSEKYYELVDSFNSIKNELPYEPDCSLVLGSGLSLFLEGKKIDKVIKYQDIKNMPISTVDGHNGSFVFLKLGDKKVVCMNGRVHFYEGYTMDEVVKPIRLMKLMGAKSILLTNAAGGVNEHFKPGDLMVINDHISSFVRSPLIGENLDELGDRFPDMTEVYDKKIINHIKNSAMKLNIDIKEGIYLQFTGPCYETIAEVKMARILGADCVGMSTVVEAIVARHMGIRVGGISLITNMAAGLSKNKLSHEEVKETAKMAGEKFSKLVEKIIINSEF